MITINITIAHWNELVSKRSLSQAHRSAAEDPVLSDNLVRCHLVVYAECQTGSVALWVKTWRRLGKSHAEVSMLSRQFSDDSGLRLDPMHFLDEVQNDFKVGLN
jgi:hypothetical protein